jgi:methionyl-tRNA synthetase
MKFYITTPIYYVNDRPHIGHAYTTIIADILARWKRLNNFDVYFLTGTDEHGVKIVNAAKNKSITPLQLCNTMSSKFKKSWNILNISYTKFVRTTNFEHINVVTKVINLLFKKGLLFEKQYKGLYCIGCERFYTKKELDKKGNCLLHKKKAIFFSEKNYFFKLSHFQEQILDILTNVNNKNYMEILPKERMHEIVGKLKLGLEDISLSRNNLNWGISLPFDKEQTVYVWIDALLSYISGINYSLNNELFQKIWPANVHFIGKDILWFHAVIWPAILISLELPLPKRIYSHGFFSINNCKMSKSLGNVIPPDKVINKYGIEATRYLLVSLFPLGVDGDISWSVLSKKYNKDLADNLGNLICRVIKMYEKYFNFNLPLLEKKKGLILAKKISFSLKENFISNMNNVQFYMAIKFLQKNITLVNKQIEYDSPWKLVNSQENENKLTICIYSYLQAIVLITIYLKPFMPSLAEKIQKKLCSVDTENAINNFFINGAMIPKDGFSLSKKKINLGIIFPKIKD